jgi:hypothetical protein
MKLWVEGRVGLKNFGYTRYTIVAKETDSDDYLIELFEQRQMRIMELMS